MGWLLHRHGVRFTTYDELWQWSVAEPEQFWWACWEFFECHSDTPVEKVLAERKMPGARWFEGATVSYAYELLKATETHQERTAIVFVSEGAERQEISWKRLRDNAAALAATLESLGVQPGERVVSYMPNIPATVMALAATSAVGAVWSSCSPDMGATGVLDRFQQIAPVVLFAVDGYHYGGKPFDRSAVVRELVAGLPSLRAVVWVDNLLEPVSLDLDASLAARVKVVSFTDAIAVPAPWQPRFVAFDHPLWIVYSSGTTGLPKPIVHGHGGTILENQKGNQLHLDLKSDDVFSWFSSTSWIMWNLWVSTLALGCTVVQIDGNPGYPNLERLWALAEQEKVTFFGASPAFYGLCMKQGLQPGKRFNLSSLRSMGSTGSPLTQEHYEWIYREVAQDVMLASISGGTDPGAAFLTSCPLLPIYSGEMQCRGLGCAVAAFDDAGNPLVDEVGELVVTLPMPSMPLYFWGDSDGSRYFGSYFDQYPGAWRHGDWLKLIPRPEGMGAVIYGRSDSTINRHGIRMGTSELYRVVEQFDAVADSLAVDLEYLGKPSFLALFVVPADMPAVDTFDLANPSAASKAIPLELKEGVKQAIRTQLSARHVPDEVFFLPEVPRTLSGKKLEVPVKRLLLGHAPEKAVNRSSMANPDVIDWILEFAQHWQSQA
jgi:acetoacetyl-CoA synthetase